MSAAKFKYQVIEKNFLTNQHLQLKIAPIDQTINYESGQYIELLYPDGKFQPFSIANAPCKDHTIELHIKLLPSDIATLNLTATLKIGSSITLTGPFGESQYTDRPGTVLLLAAGTGFAPAKAILEKLIQTNTQKKCYLYWSVKKNSDLYLTNLITSWQSSLPHFHFSLIQTQEGVGLKKNIFDEVNKDFKDLQDCQTYVFGPLDMARQAIIELKKKGLQQQNFFSDMLSKTDIQSLFEHL